MISEKTREMIMPYLKLHLDKEDWRYIDDMFSEVYLIKENGLNIISLKPFPRSKDITIQFSAINGAYVCIDYWEEVKQRGKKL